MTNEKDSSSATLAGSGVAKEVFLCHQDSRGLWSSDKLVDREKDGVFVDQISVMAAWWWRERDSHSEEREEGNVKEVGVLQWNL